MHVKQKQRKKSNFLNSHVIYFSSIVDDSSLDEEEGTGELQPQWQQLLCHFLPPLGGTPPTFAGREERRNSSQPQKRPSSPPPLPFFFQSCNYPDSSSIRSLSAKSTATALSNATARGRSAPIMQSNSVGKPCERGRGRGKKTQPPFS